MSPCTGSRVTANYERENCFMCWMPALRARFMGPTWGPSGADRTQVDPMMARLILLSGSIKPRALQSVSSVVTTRPWLIRQKRICTSRMVSDTEHSNELTICRKDPMKQPWMVWVNALCECVECDNITTKNAATPYTYHMHAHSFIVVLLGFVVILQRKYVV